MSIDTNGNSYQEPDWSLIGLWSSHLRSTWASDGEPKKHRHRTGSIDSNDLTVVFCNRSGYEGGTLSVMGSLSCVLRYFRINIRWIFFHVFNAQGFGETSVIGCYGTAGGRRQDLVDAYQPIGNPPAGDLVRRMMALNLLNWLDECPCVASNFWCM